MLILGTGFGDHQTPPQLVALFRERESGGAESDDFFLHVEQVNSKATQQAGKKEASKVS